jgi:cyclopropane fatty-acyl-phospholipid synthase-like methyltransferase
MDEEHDQRYAFYFDSDRPAAVDRLIQRKHRTIFRLVSRESSMRKVLEVGPGEGRFAGLVRSSGRSSYTAVEASHVGAERLREAGFEVIEASVPPLPDQLGRYDCIYASHLVEHLRSSDEVRSFLRGSRGHLTQDGVVALVFPDARWMGFEFWDADYTHHWPSTERRIRQAAVDAGLEVVTCDRVCLTQTGRRARLLAWALRLYPYTLLASLFPRAKEFLYRGKLLFSFDVVVILRAAARS